MWVAAVTATLAAADVPPVGEPIPEIVVTGERVSRPIVKTQSSVEVFTGARIEGLAAANRIEDLLLLTPNIQLGSGAEGPTIRGQDSTGPLRDLPAFLGGTRPRVTLEVDGRPIGYNELAFGVTPLWDVAQVEIYRTPQSTTQGRNAIAGAIFVTTAEPDFDWNGRARLIAGDARTRQLSALVSGPLLADQLAVRLSADARRSRTSSQMINPADADPNRDDSDSIRGKILITPRALAGSRIELVASHIQSQMPQIEGIQPPFRARRDPSATYGIFDNRVDALTAMWSQVFSPALDLKLTGTAGRARIRRHAPSGFGEARNRGSDRALEAVVHWRAPGMMRVTGGLRWDSTALDQAIDLSATPLGVGAFGDRQRSFGLFGEANIEAWPRLTVTGGLRYQRDRHDRSGAFAGILGQLPLDYRRQVDALLPKVSIAYRLAPGVEAGVLIQRAYNPGGTTLDLKNAVAQEFGRETLWDREVFARASLLGGDLVVAANLFDQAMRNTQRPVSLIFATVRGNVGYAQIVNEPRAESRGAEAQFDWRPSGKLQLAGGIGLLRTRITRAQSPDDPFLGKRFQRSPAFSASLAGEWRPAAPLRLSAQLRHNSAYFSNDTETRFQRVGGSTTVSGRAAWQAGPITLFGYARNLFDEFHLTYIFPSNPVRRLATAGDPRELGIGLEGRF